MKTQQTFPGLLKLSLFFASVTPAFSAAIATYDITTATANLTSLNPGGVPSGMSASTLSRGVDATAVDGTFDTVTGAFGAVSWTTAASATDTYYFQFTITPDAGNSITYTSLSYGLCRERGFEDGLLEGPATWELQYSLNGSTYFSLATQNLSLGAAETLHQANFTTSLSAIGTQSTPVIFRFYGYNRPDNGVGSEVSFGGLSDGSGSIPDLGGSYAWSGTGSDVILDGALVAVPEPRAYAFVAGLSILSFAAYRNRNRKSKS